MLGHDSCVFHPVDLWHLRVFLFVFYNFNLKLIVLAENQILDMTPDGHTHSPVTLQTISPLLLDKLITIITISSIMETRFANHFSRSQTFNSQEACEKVKQKLLRRVEFGREMLVWFIEMGGRHHSSPMLLF